MIPIQYNTQLGSYHEIRGFIQKEQYEPYLCKILKSCSFFELDLQQLDNQNHGEDDFYSESTGNTYESTLIIPKDMLTDLKKGIEIWTDDIFKEKVFKKAKDDILRMVDKKVAKGKRNIVLFNIVPLRKPQLPASIFYRSVFAQFMCSTWKQILIELKENIPMGTNIFIVSYNPDNTFYIEEIFPIDSNKKEYIKRLNKNDGFPFYSEIITPPSVSSYPSPLLLG